MLPVGDGFDDGMQAGGVHLNDGLAVAGDRFQEILKFERVTQDVDDGCFRAGDLFVHQYDWLELCDCKRQLPRLVCILPLVKVVYRASAVGGLTNRA